MVLEKEQGQILVPSVLSISCQPVICRGTLGGQEHCQNGKPAWCKQVGVCGTSTGTETGYGFAGKITNRYGVEEERMTTTRSETLWASKEREGTLASASFSLCFLYILLLCSLLRGLVSSAHKNISKKVTVFSPTFNALPFQLKLRNEKLDNFSSKHDFTPQSSSILLLAIIRVFLFV